MKTTRIEFRKFFNLVCLGWHFKYKLTMHFTACTLRSFRCAIDRLLIVDFVSLSFIHSSLCYWVNWISPMVKKKIDILISIWRFYELMWLMDKCLNSTYVRIGKQDLAYNKTLCKIPLVVYIYTPIFVNYGW